MSTRGALMEDTSSSASSPDPLTFATSPSPTKLRAARRSSRLSQPLAQRSPNVQRSDPFLDLPSLEKTSPSKTITMTTPRAHGSSPWRIKVTVEAEQEEDEETPTRPYSTRIETTTTTVPLKGLEDSSPVKRRGRPRKSDKPSETTKKRSGTPVRRRKSIVRSPDENAGESSVSDAAVPPKRRGRPRKSMTKDTQVPEPLRAAAMYGPRSPGETQDEQQELSKEQEPPLGVPAQSTRTSTEAPSSAPSRRRSTRRSARFSEAAVDTDTEVQLPHETAPRSKAFTSSQSRNDAVMWCSMTSNYEYDSEPTMEEDGETSDDDGGFDMTLPDVTIPDITVPDVVGETTMINSEGFSMVSIDSLPSRQTGISSPLERKATEIQPQHSARAPSRQVNAMPSEHRDSINLPTGPLPMSKTNNASAVESSVLSVSYMPSSPPVRFSARTPSRNLKSPTAPPVIEEAAPPSPSKTATPKLSGVVKAGMALQGVVDGNNRGTMERRPSDDIREQAQLKRLDNLFSSFEDGTRRELQAGLRLGQQLAERARSRTATRETTREPSPLRQEAPSTNSAPDEDVFGAPAADPNNESNNQRLPTPEENDYAIAIPPPPTTYTEVKYPNLSVESQPTQLISPVRSHGSESGESYRANTPPSTKDSEEEEYVPRPSNYIDFEDSVLQQEPGEDFDHYWQRRREVISKKIQEANASQVIVIDSDNESSEVSAENEENGDIWEEEASRTSDTRPAGRREKQREAFSNNGSATNSSRWERSARTSRRGGIAASQNSSDTIRVARPSPRTQAQDQGSSTSSERVNTPETSSEDDDSTGLFWQGNQPSSSKAPEPPQGKTDKLDLSMLLDTNNTPQKPTIFKAPYNMGTQLTSPVKGSPLKRQVLFSSPTAASSSPYSKVEHSIEASALGNSSMYDSSTHHSSVHEGDSMTSDIRQLRMETEARREVVNEPSVQQEPQDYEMEDPPEVEEEETEVLASPRRKDSHMTSLHINRERKPLFSAEAAPAKPVTTRPQPSQRTEPQIHPSHLYVQQQRNSGLFSRVWSAFGSATAVEQPSLHPLIASKPALPKYAPWTNTHCRALDRLFQKYKKSPELFSPTHPSNAGILEQLRPEPTSLRAPPPHKMRQVPLVAHVGTEFQTWGYTTLMSAELLVLVGIFMQLLTLEERDDYARFTGKALEPAHGEDQRPGEEIWACMVTLRLFSIVAGEDLRRDEKKGKSIDREERDPKVKNRPGKGRRNDVYTPMERAG